jgi:hypothetical protein
MRDLRTFTGKYVSRGGLVEIIGLAATGPPPKEVPHGDAQDGDTGDTTDYATNDCTNRSCCICGHDWITT